MRLFALALVLSGCWLALPSETQPPVHYAGDPRCVYRVRSGRHSHYEHDGERINSFALERLIRPDPRGRAGFRMQRAGNALFALALVLHLGALSTLGGGAFADSHGTIPRWAGITTLSLEGSMGAALGAGIPLSVEGDERVRAAVGTFNAQSGCP